MEGAASGLDGLEMRRKRGKLLLDVIQLLTKRIAPCCEFCDLRLALSAFRSERSQRICVIALCLLEFGGQCLTF